MEIKYVAALLCITAVLVLNGGCGEEDRRNVAILGGAIMSGIAQTQQAQKMYQRPDWKPEDYFDDPQVIRLCHAIRNRDIALIDRLIAEGADVNAQGVGNMTPLLWAFVQGRPWKKPPSRSNDSFPSNIDKWALEEFDAIHLSIFTKLLEHGADPNVRFTNSFFPAIGLPEDGKPHTPITRVIARLPFPYFEAVMDNGGDQHLYSSINEGITYSDMVVQRAGYLASKADMLKKNQWLIASGIDVNQVSEAGTTFLMSAVNSGDYDLAIMLIEAGADWLMAFPDNPGFLASIVHTLVQQDNPQMTSSPLYGVFRSPERFASYLKLIEILEERGADFDLERKIVRPGQIELVRMNTEKAELIRQELRILEQQRRELYERIRQKE